MKKKRSTQTATPQVTPTPTEDAAVAPGERSRVESLPIVGIGASAGGLEASTQLLNALPLDPGISVSGLVKYRRMP